MNECASLGTTINQVEYTVTKVKSPVINNSFMKFTLGVMASISIIYLTGYFFEKGSIAAGK